MTFIFLSLSLCVPVNRGLLILLVLVAFALLYNKTRLQTLPKYSGTIACTPILMVSVCYIDLIVLYTVLKKEEADTGVEDEEEMYTDVPVLICASEERIGASMTVINSVYSNSQARVFFYIVTLRDAIKKIRCLV